MLVHHDGAEQDGSDSASATADTRMNQYGDDLSCLREASIVCYICECHVIAELDGVGGGKRLPAEIQSHISTENPFLNKVSTDKQYEEALIKSNANIKDSPVVLVHRQKDLVGAD